MIKIQIEGNYYGGLWVKKEGQRFWWSIECYNGHKWEEISEVLYNALLDHNSNRAE